MSQKSSLTNQLSSLKNQAAGPLIQSQSRATPLRCCSLVGQHSQVPAKAQGPQQGRTADSKQEASQAIFFKISPTDLGSLELVTGRHKGFPGIQLHRPDATPPPPMAGDRQAIALLACQLTDLGRQDLLWQGQEREAMLKTLESIGVAARKTPTIMPDTGRPATRGAVAARCSPDVNISCSDAESGEEALSPDTAAAAKTAALTITQLIPVVYEVQLESAHIPLVVHVRKDWAGWQTRKSGLVSCFLWPYSHAPPGSTEEVASSEPFLPSKPSQLIDSSNAQPSSLLPSQETRGVPAPEQAHQLSGGTGLTVDQPASAGFTASSQARGCMATQQGVPAAAK
ncbi:hypothetical protein WJX79_008351 [Trebouxia sp. C0005]